MVDWTQVLNTLIGAVPATIAAAGAVWLGRLNALKIDRTRARLDEATVQIDQTAAKIDQNTAITRGGAAAAGVAAKKADTLAAKTDTLTSTVAEKLNGGLDERIRDVFREQMVPFAAAYESHVEQDDRNMKEIRVALGELRDRLPKEKQS